jgi:catecholate siderophore receptor
MKKRRFSSKWAAKKSKRVNRTKWGRVGPKYCLFLSTLAAAPTIGNRVAAPLLAQENRPSATATNSEQTVFQFNIPPGVLETVLRAFGDVTGVRTVASRMGIYDLASPGVQGSYTAEQALQQVLRGSGVGYRFTEPGVAMLDLQQLQTEIEVRERVEPIAGPPSSPKYTAPIVDIPQTITVIPKNVIEEQGATTLRDVLRNVPGLTIAAGEGGTPAGDNLTLRGFSARNDVFVDGVRDLGPQSRDPFNLEQLEVVKGPASAYTGRGSTGGSINMVSKQPQLDPLYGLTLNFGTDRTKRITADVNTPLQEVGLGERTSLRLNFMMHESGVAGRNVVENQRWGVAPSLSLGLGTPTKLTLSYFHLKQDNISDYGIPWVPPTNNVLVAYRDKPAPVPRETFYGFRHRDAEKLGSNLGTLRFEHTFNDNVSVQEQLRYGHSTRDSMATPPRFASNDSTIINREMRSWITNDDVWDNQTDLHAQFATGPLRHALVGGLDISNENNTRKTRTAPNSPTTLLNPNPDDVYTGVITLSPDVGDVTGKTVSLYALDTAQLSRNWEITGGLRWDRFDVEGVSTTLAPIDHVDEMVSGRGSIVFKPRRDASIYASYGTSMNPSLEGLSYQTGNASVDPEKTYTLEFGSKWDLLDSRLLLSGALFRVNKTNARTPGILPDDPPQVLEGEQRVRGIELAATGMITSTWKVFAGYTLLDSEVVKSNTPTEVGRELPLTPRNSFNIWTTYGIRKLTVGLGAGFVDKRFNNTSNARFVEGYWLVDAMASFPLTDHLDLRLNVYNLTDKHYFDRVGGGHVVPGAGRSATLGTTIRF